MPRQLFKFHTVSPPRPKRGQKLSRPLLSHMHLRQALSFLTKSDPRTSSAEEKENSFREQSDKCRIRARKGISSYLKHTPILSPSSWSRVIRILDYREGKHLSIWVSSQSRGQRPPWSTLWVCHGHNVQDRGKCWSPISISMIREKTSFPHTHTNLHSHSS